MVQKLEVIKGGGGSVRVGTTGTIGSLMTKELDSMRSPSQTLTSTREKPSAGPFSINCGVATSPKELKPRRAEDPSSSGSSSSRTGNINTYPESNKQTRHNIRKKTYHIPMLASDNAAVEMTPNREKAEKKTNFVEVVDIRCRNPDKRSSPLASRFKKLSFSKLSENIN